MEAGATKGSQNEGYLIFAFMDRHFPKINFGKLIDQLLEAKEEKIILYQITTENFRLDDFATAVREETFSYYRKYHTLINFFLRIVVIFHSFFYC